jgi:tetratricopeptide (TPR) repeat protein
LADLYKSIGRYAEAEPLCLRSLAICEEQLGINHPFTAMSLNNLAELYVYYAIDKYNDAESLFLRALQIAENILGVNHPNTKTIRNNLEILRQQMNSEQLNNSPT